MFSEKQVNLLDAFFTAVQIVKEKVIKDRTIADAEKIATLLCAILEKVSDAELKKAIRHLNTECGNEFCQQTMSLVEKDPTKNMREALIELYKVHGWNFFHLLHGPI